MCKVFNGGAELEVVQRPKSLNEGPESFLEMYIARKARSKLGSFVNLRRQVFEQIEDQAVLVV